MLTNLLAARGVSGRRCAMPESADRAGSRPRLPLFSPIGFLALAAVIGAAFAALHVAGLRESTRVFSGTTGGGATEAMQGAAYALGYFVTVLGAPVLLIATAAFLALLRAFPGKGSSAGRP